MSPVSGDSNVERLKRWADTRKLCVSASRGDQREPENVVAVTTPLIDDDGGSYRKTLLRRDSLDSIDTAALYVIQALAALGVDVP